jgi:hypothetical protein
MAIYKLATTIWHDSVLPRDGVMINPVVNATAGFADVESLGDDWLDAIKTWSNVGTTNQMQVKIYDAQGSKPVFPVYEKMINTGLSTPAGGPRELAICLSFYATNNVKRRRGRLYVPNFWHSGAGTYASRPTQAMRDKIDDLATLLSNLGGVDIDWSVFSKADNTARKVTNWYVDDEWDVQRRRGLRPTARNAGTVSG